MVLKAVRAKTEAALRRLPSVSGATVPAPSPTRGFLRVMNDAGEQDLDAERANVLQVVPPESVRLRERLQIEMGSKGDYDLLKKAVDEGRITAAMLIEKANGKV